MTRVRNEALLSSRLFRTACLAFLLIFIPQLAWVPLAIGSAVVIEESIPSTASLTGQWHQKSVWIGNEEPRPRVEVEDDHPIRGLMHEADHAFEQYDRNRSRTFKQAVDEYRRRYKRHPPPMFDKWYKFARRRNVHNIDDFQQIHDDLRPFWAVGPFELRCFAAHAADVPGHKIATISVRDGKVFEAGREGWRSNDFLAMLANVAKNLPDMDIPMNRMDQPRVVVSWDDLQAALEVEESSRSLNDGATLNNFTENMSGLLKVEPSSRLPRWLNRFRLSSQQLLGEDPQASSGPRYQWFPYAGKPFMDIASTACPPDSYARNTGSADDLQRSELTYKHDLSGFITDTNRSSDLCTIGPQLSQLHGLLYASTSMLVTHGLLPVFSECKTSVNNDILFPASIYYKQDKHYLYQELGDASWDDKRDVVFWRGSTSGGNAYESMPGRWHSMHRQRFVTMMNSTELADTPTSILALADAENTTYIPHEFAPAPFVAKHADIGFVKKIACIPNCSFYDSTFSLSKWTPFAEAFKSKFLIDLDGHTFSGRWRAYLQSRSLGFKATIIREWHDTRLWAWRHFVPVDNRYDDLFGLLTYFIGYDGHDGVAIPRHDYEAFKIAQQSRDWAAKVLRREDMDIYLFRLLLEYARLIDDNRDRIGFTGDGGAEMEEFDLEYPAVD